MAVSNYRNIPISNSQKTSSRKVTTRKQPPGNRRRWLVKLFAASFALLILVLLVPLSFYCLELKEQYRLIDQSMNGALEKKYHVARFAPFVLTTGSDIDAVHLIERLQQRGYVREDGTEDPGSYRLAGRRLFLHTKGGQFPSTRVALELRGSVIELMSNLDSGRIIDQVVFEPRIFTHFVDSMFEARQPLSYENFPPVLVNAVLAAEDKRFFSHFGLDLQAIFRAVVQNVLSGKVVMGGSTISQQCVKMIQKRRKRTVLKKVNEALLTLVLELNFAKEEILTYYLNNLYLGALPPFEIRGMAAASRLLLRKPLNRLSVSECALLAGLIRSPNGNSPRLHPQGAEKTGRTVQNLMDMLPWPPAFTSPGDNLILPDNADLIWHPSMAYFLDQAQKQLETIGSIPSPASMQYTVQLTVDPWIQWQCQKNVTEGLSLVEKKRKFSQNSLQGAAVVMEPATGRIQAVVGGRDYINSPFNRAVRMWRSIGSLVKPFVYFTAMGGDGMEGALTQADILHDTPIRIHQVTGDWKPHNFDKKYLGSITVRRALVLSRNIPAVRVGMRAGSRRVVNLLRELAINPDPSPWPSLFLGTIESSPMRIAAGYSMFANGGTKVVPTAIDFIMQGNSFLWQPPSGNQRFSPQHCYVITDILKGVLVNGTAKKAGKVGLANKAAGKTGTSGKLRDTWFAGYTPHHTTVVWVGRDDNKPAGLTGASGALPIWTALVKGFTGKASQPFIEPDGITYSFVDRDTGRKTFAEDGRAVKMAFITDEAATKARVHQVASKYRQREKGTSL